MYFTCIIMFKNICPLALDPTVKPKIIQTPDIIFDIFFHQ